MTDEIEKKYFTIGEVAEMIGEAPSLIRFWETEFDFLKPEKTEKGTRKYTRKDIQQLQLVHHLVKEKGFTLQGAKEHIKRNNHAAEDAVILDTLKNLRNMLTELRKQLDHKNS